MPTNAAFYTSGPKEFFRRYPVRYINQLPDPVGVIGPALPPRIKGDPVQGQGSVQKQQRVRYLTFSRRLEPLASVSSPRCTCPVHIAVGSDVTGIPAFYLPYQNDYNYRTTLSAAGHNAADADFFLTELVDGCSIYVEGTDQTPTVYHINAANTAHSGVHPHSFASIAAAGHFNVAAMNAIQRHNLKFQFKSAKMDDRFRNDAAHGPKALFAGVGVVRQNRKLENNDYMLIPDSPAEVAFNQSLPAIAALQKAPTQIGTKTVDRMSCVTTQGFVFGIRSGGNWKFYVQLNAMVEYFHLTAKAGPRLGAFLQCQDRPQVSLGRHWLVRDVVQFWPGAKIGSDMV